MKRIRIVLILLCGLMSPFAVRPAAIAVEGVEEALGKSGAESLISSTERELSQFADSAFSSVSKEEGSVSGAALKIIKADQDKALTDLGNSLEGLTKDQAEDVIASFKSASKESFDRIANATKRLDGETDAAFASRLGKTTEEFGDTFSTSFKNNLDNLGLPEKDLASITKSMKAADEERDLPIVGERPKQVEPEGAAQPEPAGVSDPAQVAEVKAARTDLADRQVALGKKLGDLNGGEKSLVTSPRVRIEDGTDSGIESEDEALVESLSPKEGLGSVGYGTPPRLNFLERAVAKALRGSKLLADRAEARAAEIDRLVGVIDDTEGKIFALEKDVRGFKKSVKDPVTGKETATGSVTIPLKSVKSLEQTAGVKAVFKDRDGKPLKFDDADVKVTTATEKNGPFEDKEVMTVEVTIRGKGGASDQVLKFRLENPSALEKEILESGRGRFTLGSDGKLSFKSDDEGLLVTISDALEAQAEEIESLKARLTSAKAALKEQTWPWERASRIASDSVVKALRKIADDPKGALSATGRGIGRGAKATASGAKTAVLKIGNGILEVVKMMMTGVFFGVPSMIYQTLMQQAAAKALYEQITSVYHITPDFAVQIPASLISAGNAAQAGTYLYVAVDPSTSGYGNNMSSTALENASYYVVYQSGAQWGSTYATSQNAFGVWVNLNTGLVFMDGGLPYSDQKPFTYLMEPTGDAALQAATGTQTTLSVQNYTQAAFDAVGNRANYNYSEGFMDSIAPWNIATESYDHAVTPNSTLQLMFAPIETSVTHGKEKLQKASNYAPKVLVRTLNLFRTGIQNVAGFLPASTIPASTTSASAVTGPKISIRQFEGTGILNRVLGSQSSADAVDQSIRLIAALSSTVSKNASGKTTNAVQAVVDAQAGLKQALSDATSTKYGNEVDAASAALKNARRDLQDAISRVAGSTNVGLDSSFDVNAYNIYLYETEDTPIVQFMKQNRFSDLIPVKDYVVFLDTNYNITRLFSTAVITRPDGVAVIDFDTSQINPNIQYMVSLVTGLVYLYNSTGPGTLVPTLNNMPASQYVSTVVMPALLSSVALVLQSTDCTNLINQILTMANYATNLSYQGPIVKNGCLFEKVSLEISKEAAAVVKQQSLDSALNGVMITVPSGKNSDKIPAAFGSSIVASIPQSQLDSMCLYKVSKIVQGNKAQAGVFGTNAAGQPVYDYVVPVAQTSLANADGSTTSLMQIMPLGIAEAAGTTSISGVQMMVSLVTGQVYDNNYCLITNIPATVMERSANFNPIQAQPGQDSILFPENQLQKDGTVATVNVPVAVIRNLPLGTAFMPTFCNPFNITYGSLFANPDYEADTAALTAAQKQVQDISNEIAGYLDTAVYASTAKEVWDTLYAAYAAGGQKSAQTFYDKISTAYAPWLMVSGEPALKAAVAGKPAVKVAPGKLLTALQNWITASAALVPLQQTLRSKVQALQSVLQPPYAPVPKATDQMLIMAPMYWMHYAKFTWAAQNASAQPITYNGPNGQPVTLPAGLAINWINTTPSTSSTPLGCSYAQAIPLANVRDIMQAYEGWQEIMNSADGVAKVMQSGPFQFSKNENYNVYLTLPPSGPSSGPSDSATGNFFYNMVPVASPNTLFVVGNLDAGIAGSISGSLAQNATSGLTAPLTIDQCNTGDSLGKSYVSMLTANPVAIDISTGDVWIPAPLGYFATCYNTAQGNVASAQCNIFKIGKLDPAKVLDVALANQGTTKAHMQIDNPPLYSMLMNCQAFAVEQAQLAFSTYFAGNLLSLCQEEITNGTFIYAVNVTPENYYEATDYWVATDSGGKPIGILTPKTQYMVSVVTGNVYQMNVSQKQSDGSLVGQQQTAQATTQNITIGVGVATNETPQTVFEKMFGVKSYAYRSTLLTPVATNNSKLYNIIESLNNVQYQNFLQSQFAPSANVTIMAGQLPLTALQAASPVSPLYSTLYLVNGKYYLAMPGAGGSPTYYYDFNAETQDVNTSGDTPVYTPIPGDAQRGMYYMIEGTGSSAVATPVSSNTGYGCQAMRMRFGIQVAKDGTQTMGLPVYNPPLPMTANDAQLKAGESGDNMKCLTPSATIAANAQVTDTYTYYQYKNIVSESYLTRCYLNTMIPVYNKATQTATTLPENQDYYVDLVTGECYSPDGTPRLSQITVAYNFTGGASTGIVANSALDFSNPLFVWGELDLLGESLQANMMYQDTNADPANGYNEYQVQPYSTSFTLYNGGNQTVYAYTVDGAGNIQITQNGNAMSPAQTSMSSVLVNALNSGSSLATKSYTMNVNGVIPSGTPAAGATVTVTETYMNPKQYMISYTDAAGVLITGMFQTPVTSGAGTAPGASTNLYNKPPLDAQFQAQLLQGKPFCARVFASCPYGQETVQNINTTIANATTQQKELALGTTGVTCGLLYQPATATNFTLSSAGLLSAIFSGANPAGSTGAMNGQYFAFYDSYNNGSGSSTTVVPNKGQYGTYASVVSSMDTNENASSPYPGLYAGSFNVEFAATTSTPAVAPATPVPVVTTYGAPYLRVMPLPGTYDSTNMMPSYAVPPASGTEYLYKYLYNIVPNATLAQLKSTLNISGNVAGFMQLVSAIDTGSLARATVSNASMNEAAAAAITNQVSYGKPLNALTQEPNGGRYLYKLACGSGGADAASTALTNGLCQMFYTAGATNPDTYVDMYNGIVFQLKAKTTVLYPIGFSVSHDQRNAISQMVGGAIPTPGSKALTIQTPIAGKGALAAVVPAT